MEDEAVEIMYSEESEASQLRLLKAIESWASKEVQRSEMDMTGFGAALSNELVNFEKSLYPLFIKKFKCNFVPMNGFWHSVDNEKDISSLNEKSNK